MSDSAAALSSPGVPTRRPTIAYVRWVALAVMAVYYMGPLFTQLPAVALVRPLATLIFTALFIRSVEGWRQVATYAAITFLVSWTAEELSIHTGVTFGAYVYSDLLGSKVWNVPLAVPILYMTAGYCALALGRLLTGILDVPRGWRLVALATASTFIMVGWDVAMDPLNSTVGGKWIWTRGGDYFGVPLHNFAGWFITNLTIYVVFLLLSRYLSPPRPTPETARRGLWAEPMVFWCALAAPIVTGPMLGAPSGSYSRLNVVPPPPATPIPQMVWILSLVAIFAMIAPVFYALVRLTQTPTLPLAGVSANVEAPLHDASGPRSLLRDPAIWFLIVLWLVYVIAVAQLGLMGGYAPPLPSP